MTETIETETTKVKITKTEAEKPTTAKAAKTTLTTESTHDPRH